jgi:glycerol-3-phosphate O-acyltransferase
VDRYKFADKRRVIEEILGESAIADAVRAHAQLTGEAEADSWARVRRYLDEIVPQFNVLMYYRVGYAAANALLRLFWNVSVESASPGAVQRLPKDTIVIYLINHRSNADYVLVAYALAGHVSISYAVGEWARTFPLELLFKRFGSYFIRRGYRETLYHTVLEQYVRHITERGVTQGIFPEGGLTRDGALRPGKIGLLDYMLSAARDPAIRARLHLVPVALNYDRVLEDRTLLRELHLRDQRKRESATHASDIDASGIHEAGTHSPQPEASSAGNWDSFGMPQPPSERSPAARLAQLLGVARFLAWNFGRLLTGRFKRYGRAALVIGDAVPLALWFDAEDARAQSAGEDRFFSLPREQRLARVQSLCDDMMARINAIIPVTPVPLACAAILHFPEHIIPRDKLLDRMQQLRAQLDELNAREIRRDRSIEDTFDVAYRMLRMRRILSRTGDSYMVLDRGRELIRYYARSIEGVVDIGEASAKTGFARDERLRG